jgi:large subunit ribosomal protein L35Ae
MKAVITSFRRGRHVQRTNQFLVDIEGCDTRAKAAGYIGKQVVWTSSAGKKIYGKVTQPHGNSGVLRARFTKGLPGTALGKEVEITE